MVGKNWLIHIRNRNNVRSVSLHLFQYLILNNEATYICPQYYSPIIIPSFQKDHTTKRKLGIILSCSHIEPLLITFLNFPILLIFMIFSLRFMIRWHTEHYCSYKSYADNNKLPLLKCSQFCYIVSFLRFLSIALGVTNIQYS